MTDEALIDDTLIDDALTREAVTQSGAEDPLADVPLRIANPRRVPAARYYDEMFFKLENERLWPFVWQMACRLEEIPGIGDWIEYQILEKSVIVVRTASGVKAFHNACRHRGVRIAHKDGNCAGQGFVCPFHGWRWDMDGENTFVFGRKLFNPDDLDPADLALVPCRVELWGGCAFINFDDDARSLLECLGEGAGRMDARHVDRLKVDWWRSAVLPVNWKLAMEAFMEGLHVPATHPQLHAVSPPESAQYGPGAPNPDHPHKTASASSREYVDVTIKHLSKLSEGMAGMVTADEVALAERLTDMELPDEIGPAAIAFYTRLREDITTDFKARGMPVFDLAQVARDHPFKAVEYFFPHYFLLPLFSGMSSYRIRPLTAETCLFEIWSLAFYPEDEERPAPVAPTPSSHDDPSFPEIPRQDYGNLPIQQLGLHAKGFEFMRLSHDIEGMISNYQRTIDGYLAGLPKDQLAKAASTASGGFDAPIADIGF
jgi:phenylpropionate dioxygenase-like ring-hydroxylating dioxygenase large terminal subunit